MSRTYELSSDGRQLYETLHMTSGRSNTSLVIRYVYDIPIQTRSKTVFQPWICPEGRVDGMPPRML